MTFQDKLDLNEVDRRRFRAVEANMIGLWILFGAIPPQSSPEASTRLHTLEHGPHRTRQWKRAT